MKFAENRAGDVAKHAAVAGSAELLHNNPFKALPHLAKRPTRNVDALRARMVAEWKLVKESLAAFPRDGKHFRLRFILVLAYGTGCRLSELVSLRRADLRAFTRADEDAVHWEIVVNGKGGLSPDRAD